MPFLFPPTPFAAFILPSPTSHPSPNPYHHPLSPAPPTPTFPTLQAVLSIAGQEYFFATAPQAGQVEVVELTTHAKGAVAVAAVKQRLTLQVRQRLTAQRVTAFKADYIGVN